MYSSPATSSAAYFLLLSLVVDRHREARLPDAY
jgi:hypothetical protein